MEPRKRKTLLDLDRLPTQKELREFFLANDWSARKPYDFDEWNQDKIDDKNYTQNIFNKIWHKISRKHGQKASPSCYTKEYPPEVLRSGVSDIASGSVAEMVNEHSEVVQSIFDNLSDDFLSGGIQTVKAVMTGQEIDDPQALTDEDISKVDRFVDNAMDTLMEMAVAKGKASGKELHYGICGEHGGDPVSVEFCHKIGLNYVSCSPFRVPIARLAAAQAAIKD